MKWTKEKPSSSGWFWYQNRRSIMTFYFKETPDDNTVLKLPNGTERYMKDLYGYWSDVPMVLPDGEPEFE